MGIVYEAEHEHLGQRVALKVLHAGPGTSPTVIQRFLREAQAVARLSHDHIVPIYAVGESGETHFYAMQFLEGASLDRHLAKDGPSTPENAARITATAARALHYAHELGIIHRDVKPANIVQQPDGKIVITDFGLARSERAASLTDSGAMVGTPLYMSPEQVHARRDNVDRRTDVYSLGATMYELATGRPPFQGETTQEVLQKILDEEPVPPRLVVRNLPPELEAITLKCLEKSPRHRYATGLELAQDLERFLEGEPILARRTGTFARLTRRMRKHRTISLLSATIVLVSVALVVVSFSLASRSQDATVTQLLSEARAEFQGQTYLGAERAYRQAVELAPNHSEALLGHARSLLAFGSLWQQQVEQDAQSVEAESWAAEFGTPQAVFDQGVERVEQVLAQDTEQPLAFLCRGGLFFQLALCLLTTTDEEPPAAAQELFEKSVRDIDWADQLSNSREEPEYWEAQAEVAQVRYDYVTRFPLAPPLADRLMQRSLDNETKAIDLLRRRIEIGGVRDEHPSLSRLYARRALILRSLFEQSGRFQSAADGEQNRVRLYLDACESDAKQAQRLWTHNELAKTTLAWVEAHWEAVRTQDGSPGPNEGDDEALLPTPGQIYSAISTLVTQPSVATQAFSRLLDGGREMVEEAPNWTLWNTLGEFLATPRGDNEEPTATTGDWREAESRAQAARKLSGGYAAAPTTVTPIRQEQERACQHLEAAVSLQPDNPTYWHELSFLAQVLGDTDRALQSSRRAVELAPSNPLYLDSHVRLLVQFGQTGGLDPVVAAEGAREAATRADRLVKMYPGVKRFIDLRGEAHSLEAAATPNPDAGSQ